MDTVRSEVLTSPGEAELLRSERRRSVTLVGGGEADGTQDPGEAVGPPQPGVPALSAARVHGHSLPSSGWGQRVETC